MTADEGRGVPRTMSRPGLERRMGIHRKLGAFDPVSIMVVDVHSPDGRLCYETLHLSDALYHPMTRYFHETFDDLLPRGGTWLRFETDNRPIAPTPSAERGGA